MLHHFLKLMPTKPSSSKTRTKAEDLKPLAPAKSPVAKKAIAAKTVVKELDAPKAVPLEKEATAAKTSVKPRVTTVAATLDIGWGNALYIRGEGAGLSWDKGILMDNAGADRWEWKTIAPHSGIIFKLLINDTLWSSGENLDAVCGGTSISAPVFES